MMRVQDTLELDHIMTVYFPSTKRFALLSLLVTFDAAGQVKTTGSYESLEPFMLEQGYSR